MAWHEHINKIAKKANQVINMLKRIQHLISSSTLEMLYKSLILPIVEYGNTIYDKLTADFKDKLEKFRKELLYYALVPLDL